MHCCKQLLNMSNILFRGCISGGVYVPCTYMYARWELPYWGLLYAIKRMYLWRSLCTLYLHACQVRVTLLRSSLCYLRECISGGVYVPCTYTHARWELPYWGLLYVIYENVSLVEFMYLVLTRMPGESYRIEATQVFVAVFVWRLSISSDTAYSLVCWLRYALPKLRGLGKSK